MNSKRWSALVFTVLLAVAGATANCGSDTSSGTTGTGGTGGSGGSTATSTGTG
jgi:hypothetical protein